MRKIIIPLLCLLLFNCKSENIDNQEYEIINIVIKNDIEPSLEQMRSNASNIKNDSLKWSNYFFSLDETLQPIDIHKDVYQNLINEYGSKYLKRYTQALKINLEKIKTPNGSRIMPYSSANESNKFYMGSYKFSRVIFNDSVDKAVIEFIRTNPSAITLNDKALVFLQKKDDKWEITKERGLFYNYN